MIIPIIAIEFDGNDVRLERKIKERMSENGFREFKKQLIKEFLSKENNQSNQSRENNQVVADIFLNFFLKLAVISCQEKEDKELVQRSLYLLKKALFIWPETVIKFENIKTTLSKIVGQDQNGIDRTKF
jgi:hypothetical protein